MAKRDYGRTRKLSKHNLKLAISRLLRETTELLVSLDDGRHPRIVKGHLNLAAVELQIAWNCTSQWSGVRK